MSEFSLSLFGPPRVEFNNKLIEVERRKALAFLIYLAINRQPYSRDMLATLFYPDTAQSRARAYLRRDLAVLNTTPFSPFIETDREMIELRIEAAIQIDVDQFQAHVAAIKKHTHPPDDPCAECLEHLKQAAKLYQDDFLAGFSLRDCPAFDEWQFFQTENLRQALATVLALLVKQLSAVDQFEAALPHARRLLNLDPLHEPAQRQLMQLYNQAGQSSAAIRQYEAYVTFVEAELGLPPEEETTTLYEAIKAGRLLGSFLNAEQDRQQRRSEPSDLPAVPQPASHNLPPQLTPFIGRESELTDIADLMAHEDTRLLTLVGPGGIGKTRLAVAAAQGLLDRFQQGVYFIQLAPLETIDYLVSAVGDAIGFGFLGDQEPKQQLVDYLSHRQMLLVIDNFEHLLAGVGLITDILQAAPQVKILATSRERLNLSGERLYTVGGMTYPKTISEPGPQVYSAVELLLQQAQRIRPEVKLEPEDLIEAVRICRLVQGMPLALMLAAGWAELLSWRDIADEIEHSLDFLASELQDLPERQHSMRAVFDSAWKRLSPAEQQVFMKLSIFRGSFERQAAQAITGAGLPNLRALINKSLITVHRADRYEIHELLRQYSAEQRSQAGATAQLRAEHSRFYLSRLHGLQADLIGPKQLVTLNMIERDLENIRVAWEHAVQQGDVALIEQSWESLFQFYWIKSRFQEGERAFGLAVKHVAKLSEGQPAQHALLLLRLSNRQAAFRYSLSMIQSAGEQLQQGVDQARALEDKRELAFSLNFLGEYIRTRSEFDSAIQLMEEALAIGQELDDALIIANALKGLGWAYGEEGSDYTKASACYQESLSFYRAIHHQGEMAFCLDKIAYSAWQLGDYQQSDQIFRESLALFQAIGDQLGVAKALGGLALVHLSWGGDKLSMAKSFAEEATRVCRNTGHQLELVNRLIILGTILFRMKHYEAAKQANQEARQVAIEIKYDVGLILSLNILGAIAVQQQQFEQARQLLLEALRLSLKLLRYQDLTEILVHYAGLLIAEASLASEAEGASAKREKAFMILLKSAAHSGAWQDAKDRAINLLSELEREMSPAIRQSIKSRSQNIDLLELVSALLPTETVMVRSQVIPSNRLGRRFAQQKLIARGGMGEVYQGYDTETSRLVAIKRLKPELLADNPDAVQRLRREGEILQQLNHPNIVKVLDTIDLAAQPVIIMEYVPGGSLQDLLKKQPRLPLEQVLTIALELADALARAHHQGVIHRDIKPSNVLLAEDGSPRLSDFGIAHLARSTERLTQEGAILGTTVYLSPEAWRGEELDQRSDIWSFGALLYEMLAGWPPFNGEQVAAVVAAILHQPVPDLYQVRADVPSGLIELIEQMLTKERSLRIDSMRQVAAGLELIRRGQELG